MNTIILYSIIFDQGRAISPEIVREDIIPTESKPQQRSRSPATTQRQPDLRSYSPEPQYQERAIDCYPVKSRRAEPDSYRAKPAIIENRPETQRDRDQHTSADDSEPYVSYSI